MNDNLYQEAILGHARSELRAGRLADPDATATADNPLCGDRVTFDVRIAAGRIADIAHHTRGCVLCKAAAAILAERAVGTTGAEAAAAADELRAMLEANGPPPAGEWADLAAFVPVADHRSRHTCVLLPFDALAMALTGDRTTTPD